MKEGVSQDPETCAGKREREGEGEGRERGGRGEGEAKQQVTSAIPNLVSTLCECINQIKFQSSCYAFQTYFAGVIVYVFLTFISGLGL